MSKTAEEILREVYSPSEPYSSAVSAMEDFAAQEVDAYKEKLRTAIMYADDDGSSRYREGMKSVLDLIDTVK